MFRKPQILIKYQGGIRHEVFEFVKMILWFLILVWALRAYVVEAYQVEGPSMENTLRTGQRLIVSKFSYYVEDIERGDIVIFWATTEPPRRFIKRVVGLPGDTVEIHEGKVFINKELLQEPYVNTENLEISGEFGPKTVPEGSYMVLGDHRSVSSDSRFFGFVSKDSIIGKVWFRFWPLNQLSSF